MISVWLVTDGKVGDLNQCRGVAEALGLSWEERIVTPRRLYAVLMPLGPIDPRERPRLPGSPIAPPFPDLVIASGRRSVAYLTRIKRESGGRTFTVYLKDPRLIKAPRLGSSAADLIWAPEHDRLRGSNVITTLTSPHRLSAEVLSQARQSRDGRLASLPRPRVAVLVGGDTRSARLGAGAIDGFLRRLREVATTPQPSAALGGLALPGLMITPSRRTPPQLASGLAALASETGGFFWDGSGENPYTAMLADADHLIVTSDSVNMMGEALATGAPLHIFELGGGTRKARMFRSRLAALGVVRPLGTRLETWHYAPIDATPAIAAEIWRRFERHRAALGPTG